MKPEEKLKLIRDLVIQNLMYYDAPIAEVKVKLFAADLADLELADLERALVNFRREPGRRMMPMPSDIRHKIKPVLVSDEALCIEAVARIVQALSSYGPYRHDDAKNHIGQLGWEIVLRQGGWQEVCTSVGVENPIGVFQSQAVKIGKSILEQSRAGTLGTAPAIPHQPHTISPPRLDHGPSKGSGGPEPLKQLQSDPTKKIDMREIFPKMPGTEE